jgi:hypothetical protein
MTFMDCDCVYFAKRCLIGVLKPVHAKKPLLLEYRNIDHILLSTDPVIPKTASLRMPAVVPNNCDDCSGANVFVCTARQRRLRARSKPLCPIASHSNGDCHRQAQYDWCNSVLQGDDSGNALFGTRARQLDHDLPKHTREMLYRQ